MIVQAVSRLVKNNGIFCDGSIVSCGKKSVWNVKSLWKIKLDSVIKTSWN